MNEFSRTIIEDSRLGLTAQPSLTPPPSADEMKGPLAARIIQGIIKSSGPLPIRRFSVIQIFAAKLDMSNPRASGQIRFR